MSDKIEHKLNDNQRLTECYLKKKNSFGKFTQAIQTHSKRIYIVIISDSFQKKLPKLTDQTIGSKILK